MMPYSRSVRRFVSCMLVGLLAATTLSACGGTDNAVNNWWYNNTYASGEK